MLKWILLDVFVPIALATRMALGFINVLAIPMTALNFAVWSVFWWLAVTFIEHTRKKAQCLVLGDIR
jgi:hypothetical protein